MVDWMMDAVVKLGFCGGVQWGGGPKFLRLAKGEGRPLLKSNPHPTVNLWKPLENPKNQELNFPHPPGQTEKRESLCYCLQSTYFYWAWTIDTPKMTRYEPETSCTIPLSRLDESLDEAFRGRISNFEFPQLFIAVWLLLLTLKCRRKSSLSFRVLRPGQAQLRVKVRLH